MIAMRYRVYVCRDQDKSRLISALKYCFTFHVFPVEIHRNWNIHLARRKSRIHVNTLRTLTHGLKFFFINSKSSGKSNEYAGYII